MSANFPRGAAGDHRDAPPRSDSIRDITESLNFVNPERSQRDTVPTNVNRPMPTAEIVLPEIRWYGPPPAGP
jgi:hypothetical protein